MPTKAQARTTHIAQKTIAKFLNAAEEVFGQHGYEGTTIRAIAKAARANLGTLQHYWGSKRALFRDLFERRFRPLAQEHIRRLQELDERVGSGARPDVAQVLRTLIEPTFFVGTDIAGYGPDTAGQTGRKRFHALYGRALMDASPEVIAELTRIFGEPVDRFLDLMRRACPDLSDAELDWRVNCIIGAQVFSQVYAERVGSFFGDEADVEDALASDLVLNFLLNGIRSPPFERRRKTRRSAAGEQPARSGGRTARPRSGSG
jgi:AcrR family transcriptional regulator